MMCNTDNRNQPTYATGPEVSTASLAFTALMRYSPGFRSTPEPAASRIVARLAADIDANQPADRWAFAQTLAKEMTR